MPTSRPSEADSAIWVENRMFVLDPEIPRSKVLHQYTDYILIIYPHQFRHVSQFLDLDADVDVDEECSSGEETDESHREMEFIEDVPLDENDVQIHLRDLHRATPQEEHEELVHHAERFRTAYRLSLERTKSLCDNSTQPSRVILQNCEAANSFYWKISVKAGFESKCLDFLRRKCYAANQRGLPWRIGSSFARPSIPGIIYVEAQSSADIRKAFDRVHMVYSNQEIVLVPPDQLVQLMNMPTSRNRVAKGDWVRIKTGVYKGDVGYVTGVADMVQLLLVPRVSYQLDPSWSRPPPALFDVDRIRSIFGADAVQEVDHVFTFQRMQFKDGLLEQVFRPNQVSTKGVCPTFEEIELFSQSPRFPQEARETWEAHEAVFALRIHDHVEIIEGELQGTQGIITDKKGDSVELHLYSNDRNSLSNSFRLELPAVQVRKCFKIGDYVRVRYGIHVGKHGYVVKPPIDGTLVFVEWDKSGTALSIYEPDPKQHIAVYTHCVDFAEEQICMANSQDESSQDKSKTSSAPVIVRMDPMVGKKVLLVKSKHFRGYYGTIQYTHKALKLFGVRLDATGKIVQLPEQFLIEQSSGWPIYHFRKRLSGLRPLPFSAFCQQPEDVSAPTPMWESPLDSSTPAWDLSSRTPQPDHVSVYLGASCQESSPPSPLNISPQTRDQATEEVRNRLPRGVAEDWLAIDALHGKPVKVRIFGFRSHNNKFLDGTIAYTLGKPVSGEEPEIEVQVMIAGTDPVSIPLHFLVPVHPRGVTESAIIIAGEHLGLAVVVKDVKGTLWQLIPSDKSQESVVTAPMEHLVVRSRI